MQTTIEEDETPAIDMAAMMDAIFLLLIFFLISATIKKKHEELPITLPSAPKAVVVVPDNDTMVISLVNRGRGGIEYALSTIGQRMRTTGGAREMVSFQELIVALRKAAIEKPNRGIRIDADVSVPIEKVVQVTDHLKLYQLRQIGLRTQDLKMN